MSDAQKFENQAMLVRISRLVEAVRYLASRDRGEVMGIAGLADILSGKTAKQQVEAILNGELDAEITELRP